MDVQQPAILGRIGNEDVKKMKTWFPLFVLLSFITISNYSQLSQDLNISIDSFKGIKAIRYHEAESWRLCGQYFISGIIVIYGERCMSREVMAHELAHHCQWQNRQRFDTNHRLIKGDTLWNLYNHDESFERCEGGILNGH